MVKGGEGRILSPESPELREGLKQAQCSAHGETMTARRGGAMKQYIKVFKGRG